ncbi:MAG: Na/Pi cotransporter family protein [Candidatus Bipolaricaulota bacterium]|nr:Na/Pi cotransporter family protein [Candidatus Bipolaricaulota bacterium]
MVEVLFSVAGGLAVFLFGLRILSDALKRAVGDRMRVVIERLTGKAYRGALVGMVTSATLQSSTMTMVLLIGMINAGILTLAQGIGVMLGSEIGTTLTAQIIAFKIGFYYMPSIALGYFLGETFRGKKAGDVGRIILGLGLVFLGMSIFTGGLKGLAESPVILRLLQACGNNVFLGVLVGAAVTAAIHSSAAMTALVIGLGGSGLISLPAAIAIVLGANIGTTVTAQIASIGTSLSSRRLAVTQLVVNVAGVAAFLPFLPWFVRLVEMTSASLPRQIANAHTIFNVAVTLALIPCVGVLVWVARMLVRGREETSQRRAQFLGEQFLATPAIAVHQAERELVRMGEMTTAMIRACQQGIVKRDPTETASVAEVEEAIDGLKESVDADLRVMHEMEGLLEARGETAVYFMLGTLGGQRRYADVRHMERVYGWPVAHERGYPDLAGGEEVLGDMFDHAIELYQLSLAALEAEDTEGAKRALELEKHLDELETRYKAHHVARLETEECDSEAGILFIEILHNLERIGDHATNIAGDVLIIHPEAAD